MSSASIHQPPPPPVIVSFSPTAPDHPSAVDANQSSSTSSSDPLRPVPTQSVTPATPPLTPYTGSSGAKPFSDFSHTDSSSSTDPNLRRQLSSFAFPAAQSDADAVSLVAPLPQLVGGSKSGSINFGVGIDRDRFESVDTVSTVESSSSIDFAHATDEPVEGYIAPDVRIYRHASDAMTSMVANGETSAAGMNGTMGQTIRLNSPSPFDEKSAAAAAAPSSSQAYLYPSSTHLDTFSAPQPTSTMAMRRSVSPGRPISVVDPAGGAGSEQQARSSSRSPRSPTFESNDPFHPTHQDAPSSAASIRSNNSSSSQQQQQHQRPTPPPREKSSPPILSPFDHGEKPPNGGAISPIGLGIMPRPPLINSPSVPRVESATPPWTDSTAYWLSLYFAFNLGLTLFNKIVLVNFPFPYTLTGLHALSGCLGCYVALERGAFTPARLTSKENMVMTAFSVLYTINIAVSNLSLQLVTVPFHQVVRASTPLFTILISTLFFKGKFTAMKLVSLLPVVAGVGFATYGDYYFTAWGLILTLLGTFLAAFKTVITNVIQTGGGGRLRLHPLDLLMRMSPLAFIQCVIYGYFSGELERVRRYGALEMTSGKATALFVNGIIAFGLNVVSFTANKKAGPLTMTVSANCKQVMTIGIAVVLFNLHINFTNAIGIVLTLIGGAWYGYVEYTEKAKQRLGKMVGR